MNRKQFAKWFGYFGIVLAVTGLGFMLYADFETDSMIHYLDYRGASLTFIFAGLYFRSVTDNYLLKHQDTEPKVQERL